MRVVLDLTGSPEVRFKGTALWGDLPEPAPFDGVLELLRVLEAATGVRADDTDWRTKPSGREGAS